MIAVGLVCMVAGDDLQGGALVARLGDGVDGVEADQRLAADDQRFDDDRGAARRQRHVEPSSLK